MRAMLLTQTGPIEGKPLVLTELPRPVPRQGEVLLRVTACGVCRTDLHVIEGDLPHPSLPLIPGHQIVGRVEELGPGCAILKQGDRVGAAWLRSTCGSCEFCRSGRENLCPGSRYTGYHENGGYAEFAVAPEAFVYPIPQIFSDTEATPLLCAGIIGYRALLRSNLPARGSLAIFGFGSSAHITIQVARSLGAAVYVSTREEKHREFARRYGAIWTGGAADIPPVPVDSAIVFTPVGETVPVALESVKKGGTVAVAGIHLTDLPALNYERHLFHEKDLRSVEANTRDDGRGLLEQAARIPIRPTVIPFALEEANEALLQLKHGRLNGTAVLTR